MLIERPFRITNASGDCISGDLRYIDHHTQQPLIIICHGFTAHKDWGPFPYFGRFLAERGFTTIVHNFSHNGIGENSNFFTDYERFSRNTPGKELEDIQSILDAVTSGSIGKGVIDPGQIGMAGHSRGGGISILSAGSDARVQAVVAWSTIATFLRFTKHQREEWERTGYLPLRYGSNRTLLRYGISVLRDLEANGERYDLSKGVTRLEVPTLFLHGGADVIVRPEEAQALYEKSDKTITEFILLEGVGHMYGAEHPFKSTNAALERILDLTATWFHHKLS